MRRPIGGSSRRTRRSTGCRYDPDVTYICVGRDPRDVFLSWDNHVANMDILAMFAARQNAVGLDDIMDQLARGTARRGSSTRSTGSGRGSTTDGRVTERMSLRQTLHHLQDVLGRRATGRTS